MGEDKMLRGAKLIDPFEVCRAMAPITDRGDVLERIKFHPEDWRNIRLIYPSFVRIMDAGQVAFCSLPVIEDSSIQVGTAILEAVSDQRGSYTVNVGCE